MAKYQTPNTPDVDRKQHVWIRKGYKMFKCVICGGIANKPSDDADVVAVEPLTQRERDLCPNKETTR